jgi:hypothetical protein
VLLSGRCRRNGSDKYPFRVSSYQPPRILEAGEIDEAKSFLNLQLDGTIISMDSLLPYCPDGDSTRVAESLLVGIAEHRAKYPTESGEDIDHRTQAILNRIRKQNKVLDATTL